MIIFYALLLSNLFASYHPIYTPIQSKVEKVLNDYNLKGNQAVCFYDGKKSLKINHNSAVNPASITKMYSSYFLLNRLKPSFQFKTQFILSGNNLYIQGAHNPFFVTEDLLAVISKLNELGIKEVKSVYFNTAFLLNWSDQPQQITKILKKTLNTSQWSEETKSTYKDSRQYLAQNPENEISLNIDSFSIESVKQSEIYYNNDVLIITHQSSPLHLLLKQVNMFSNNFFFDQLISRLFSIEQMNSFLLKKLETTDSHLKLYTASGLGNNRTTCSLTIKLMQLLEDELTTYNLRPQDLFPVASVDEGTLQSRFTSSPDTIIGKTGTLNHVSTLAGYLKSSHGFSYFGIFNQVGSHRRAHIAQEEIVELLKDAIAGETLNYLKPNFHAYLGAKI